MKPLSELCPDPQKVLGHTPDKLGMVVAKANNFVAGANGASTKTGQV